MSGLAKTVTFDDVIPTNIIRALRRQAIAAPPQARMFWYPLASKPRTLFEQVIQRLWQWMPERDSFVGAEWWLRSPASDLALPFHFDRDEAVRNELVCPAISSVLYLTSTGGPTVIVDSAARARALPSAGVAVQPRPGRCVAFDGAFLHAVLPGRRGRWPRITIPVNWWTSPPEWPERKLPRQTRAEYPPIPERRLVTKPVRQQQRHFASTDLMSKRDWRLVVDRCHPV